MLRLTDTRVVVVAGVSTNVAIPGLALEAVNRGYHVVLPEDATAGASAETHRFMLDNFLAMVTRITTVDDVVAELKAGAGVWDASA